MDSLQNDIERYHKGELSPAEMHTLERRALDDPFLADALEGAQSVTVDELSLDLADIRSQLKERTERRPALVSMWAWTARIAAGLIVLAVATYLLVNNVVQPDAEKRTIALNEKKNSASQVAQEQLPDPVTTKEADTQLKSSSSENSISGKTTRPATSSSSAAENAPVAAIEEAPSEARSTVESGAMEISARDEIVAGVQSGFPDSRTEEQISPQAPPRLLEPKVKSEFSSQGDDKAFGYAITPPEKKVIKGQVFDSEDGKGLPGVNVIVVGSTVGTVTDADGNYEIALDDPNGGLLFSYIGFENQEIVPGANNEVNVNLSPDYAQLSEVVVVGYGTARDTLDPVTVVEMAAPQGGRRAYKQYLESQVRYPEQALEKNVEGKVTIQFTVESTGKLTDFKVLKGIGYGCDEEVIRLVKAGPKWRPTRKNTEAIRDKVKVRLRFAIPKKE